MMVVTTIIMIGMAQDTIMGFIILITHLTMLGDAAILMAGPTIIDIDIMVDISTATTIKKINRKELSVYTGILQEYLYVPRVYS